MACNLETTQEKVAAVDRAIGAMRALSELNPTRAEPFRRAISAAISGGARVDTFRALADEIDAAYRAQALANAKGGNR